MKYSYLSISEYLGVDPARFKNLNILDTNPYKDSKLFVDLVLFQSTKVPEFKNGITQVKDHFTKILTCISKKCKYKPTSQEYTIYEKKAIQLLTFKEIHGLQLGYGSHNSHGSGIGKGKAKILEEALTTLIKRNLSNPEILYLLPVLSDIAIGADNISDMVISILQQNIYEYTKRILKKLKVDKDKEVFQCQGKKYNLVPHPKYPQYPLLLIPNEILSNLPVMDAYDKYIHYNSSREIKDFLWENIISLLPLDDSTKKSDIKRVLKSVIIDKATNEDLDKIITAIKGTKAIQYDSTKDYNFIKFVKEIVANQKSTNQTELKEIINSILDKYKHFIECNTNCLLDMFIKIPTEKQLQTLLHAVIDQICQHNKLGISVEPESNGGKIDIKLSRGTEKIVIEIKKSTHKNLVTHFDNQLVDYQKSENAYGFFVVFDIQSGSKKEIKALKNTPLHSDREYMIIDTKRKIPPS
ncbi:MAG: hypothetical protein ACRC0X_06670 [Brevinema sp.]